jgi:hypothetical protein
LVFDIKILPAKRQEEVEGCNYYEKEGEVEGVEKHYLFRVIG